MPAGLHNCTTGQKTRVSALLRVLEQSVMQRDLLRPVRFRSGGSPCRPNSFTRGIAASYPPGARRDLERAGHCRVSLPGESDATDERYREAELEISGGSLGLDADRG
jgi:hypothetical protein